MSFPFSSNIMLREKGRDWKVVLTNTMTVFIDYRYMIELIQNIKQLRV